MVKTKNFIKLISALLFVIMLFYFIPTSVYAEVIDAAKNAGSEASEEVLTEDAFRYDPQSVFYEVTEKREESVKVFHLEDGSYLAAQYPDAVHYLDEDGEWQDIDNSLEKNLFGIDNRRFPR